MGKRALHRPEAYLCCFQIWRQRKGYLIKTFPQECSVHGTLIFVGMFLSEAQMLKIWHFPTAPFTLLTKISWEFYCKQEKLFV